MAAGLGSIFGGIGSLVSGFMNADAQEQAANVAQQNALLQYMLGNRNIDMQQSLGTRNLDLQELFGNRNFNLQRDTSRQNYDLASNQGNLLIQLLRNAGQQNIDNKRQGLDTQRQGLNTQRDALRGYQQNLDLQNQTAQQNIDLAKSSKFDSHGNEVYYDEATNSYKVRLKPIEQALMDANQVENLKRSTVDQDRARRGNEQNEVMRNKVAAMLPKMMQDNYRYNGPSVDEGALANQLILASRGEQEARNRAMKEGLNVSALRTGNSGAIKDIGREFRNNSAFTGSSIADAILKSKQFAQNTDFQNKQLDFNMNQQQKQSKLQQLLSVVGASKFTGDANNQMGDSDAFNTTTRQADAGATNLSRAIAGRADAVGGAMLQQAGAKNQYGNSQKQYGLAQGGLGDAYLQNAELVGGGIKSRTGAMINALSNGAAGQGSALTSAATAQGNAYNNLASALASAYTNQSSQVGSAYNQQASLLGNQRMNLSGFGDLGDGISPLLSALMQNDSGGTTDLKKTDKRLVPEPNRVL